MTNNKFLYILKLNYILAIMKVLRKVKMMNNINLIRKKADLFEESNEFADILNTIGERCGIPIRITVSESEIVCLGNQKTKDSKELTHISFQELGYRNLNAVMEKNGEKYNEILLVAMSIFDFYQKNKKELDLNYSYTFPIAEDVLGLKSQDESEWSVTFRKELRKGEKSWVTYAVLAFVLGAYGVNNFYAGQKKKGLIKLLVTCTFIGAPFMAIWGYYEAYQAYQYKKIPE